MSGTHPVNPAGSFDAADPFGTAGLRERVLAAWTASPARFREDANAEDDLVRGGYRDRVVVELAQNAADAAVRAAVPGRLLLRLTDGILTAANTGAPLDAAGVESLSTLRASTKRDGSTAGRFGVGFASVLAVTDAPRIASGTGAVRWDAAMARAIVEQVPELCAELDRRDGQLPVLRLPFPWSGAGLDGYDSVVELPLRDAAARDLAEQLLAEVDDALLLALPGLAEVRVEIGDQGRVVSGADRWQVVRRIGTHSANLLADRPVEERDRPDWSITWARPRAGQPVPAMLHAPTATDEPLDLAALLVASFPLDPTRRHVAAGALTDALVTESAAAYVELVLAVDDPIERYAMVPGPVATGRLDGSLRRAVSDALRESRWLRSVDGAAVAPRDAVAVAGAPERLLAICADVVSGLVPAHPALALLGVRRMQLVDLVDVLAEVDRPVAWWHDVYAALATEPLDAEALGALPVPLADGRVVRGPRGALLPGDGLPAEVAALGLRLVHPDAAHPMLQRLGAENVTPLTVLARPEVRVAVEAAWDEDDPDEVAGAVLGLVAAAGVGAGELPWLAALALRDTDGELTPADELVVPGSALAGLAEPGSVGEVHPDLVSRWGASVLAAVGVLADPTVAELHDLQLDPETAAADEELAGLGDWVASLQLRGPAYVAELRGVRELDVIAEDAWWRLLARVAGDPILRSAVLDPALLDTAGGGRTRATSYTAWWIRDRGRFDGRRPSDWALPEAGLDGLYDRLEPPADLPVELLAAIGVRTSLATLLAEPGGPDDLLDRLGDSRRSVPEGVLAAAYSALAEIGPDSVGAPSRVRVAAGLVAPAERVVVIDAPHHLQLAWADPPLVVPLPIAAALADVLDLDVSSSRLSSNVGGGTERPVPAEVRELLPAAPTTWWEHEELTVADTEVSWWVDDSGRVHSCTSDGLAWGLSWVGGRWSLRWAVAAVLTEPARLAELRAELRLDQP